MGTRRGGKALRDFVVGRLLDGAIYDRIVARTADNPLAQAAAIARMNQIFSVVRNERTQNQALFVRRLKDTQAEAFEKGSVTQPVTEDDFVRHRAPGQSIEEARDHYQDYLAELQKGTDRHAMAEMSSAEMRAVIARNEPTPESPGGMARAVQRRDFLQKSMEEIEKKRRDDPAGAVSKVPAVVQAQAQYDPRQPETFRSVVDARLAAQEALGIEPANRSPITKDEALRETAPIWHALPGQETRVVRDVAARFEKMFGPDWPEAFTYALGTHREDLAVKEAAATVIRQFIKGQPVSPTEARQADQQREVQAAEAAVNAGAPPRPSAPKPSAEAEFVAHAAGSRLTEEQMAEIEREADLREREAREAQGARAEQVRGTAAESAVTRARFESTMAEGTPEREAAMGRARERDATARFEADLDSLTHREEALRSRTLPTAEARRAAGQRKADIDAELARIQSQREILIAAERQRVQTAAPQNLVPEKTVTVPHRGPAWAQLTNPQNRYVRLPPADAITYLRYHPETADKFDAELGC